jgi:predicted MFS family arabinose efflux permease
MRGIFLLLGNVGVMTGPIVSAYAISIAGFTGAYIFGLGIFIVLLFSVLHDFKKYEDASYKETHIYSAVLATMKEKTLTSVVSANFILQFFYVWMVVYTPIYLAHYLHFSWETIGLIFTVMLSTFVVLDYPLGKLADWLKSEKEFTAIGFLIMVLSVFALAYVNTPSALVVGIILFCSRVGAATVEAMTEIHFFRITKESNPGLLALFSDIRPLAYILAPILGTIVLNFLPIQHIFTVLGIILLFGFCISFYMEKHKEWWVENH